MRIVVSGALALALGLAASFLVACGAKSNPALIAGSQARRLQQDLDAVRSAVSAGHCTSALPQALQRLQGEVAALPARTDPRVRARLQAGVANLGSISPASCTHNATATNTTPTTTTTTPTNTTPTDTTPTATTPTNTAPTVTTPTTSTPTTPPVSPTPTTTTTSPSGGATAP